MRFSPKTVRTKLLVAFGLLAVAPLVTLAVIETREGSAEIEARAASGLDMQSTALSQAISSYMSERWADAQVFGQNAAARGPAHELGPAIDKKMSSYAGVYDLIVVADAADGTVVGVSTVDEHNRPLDTAAMLGTSVKGQDWFEAVAGGKYGPGQSFVGPVHADPAVRQATHTDA